MASHRVYNFARERETASSASCQSPQVRYARTRKDSMQAETKRLNSSSFGFTRCDSFRQVQDARSGCTRCARCRVNLPMLEWLVSPGSPGDPWIVVAPHLLSRSERAVGWPGRL